jgi:hypothetical protein
VTANVGFFADKLRYLLRSNILTSIFKVLSFGSALLHLLSVAETAVAPSVLRPHDVTHKSPHSENNTVAVTRKTLGLSAKRQ